MPRDARRSTTSDGGSPWARTNATGLVFVSVSSGTHTTSTRTPLSSPSHHPIGTACFKSSMIVDRQPAQPSGPRSARCDHRSASRHSASAPGTERIATQVAESSHLAAFFSEIIGASAPFDGDVPEMGAGTLGRHLLPILNTLTKPNLAGRRLVERTALAVCNKRPLQRKED